MPKYSIDSFLSKDCLLCGGEFLVSKFNKKQSKKYCHSRCYLEANRENMRLLGNSNRKYHTEKEKRDSSSASSRRYYLKHIEKRRIYYRQLDKKRRGILGFFTNEEWIETLEKQKKICLMCGLYMEKPTIDHIIPISKWEEWRKGKVINYECNDIQNIQALCSHCNKSKFTKIIDTMIKYR